MKNFNEFVNESNMSYCRFENTYRDLYDCYDHFSDKLSGTEFRHRNDILELCKQIVDNYGEEGFEESSKDIDEHGNEIEYED